VALDGQAAFYAPLRPSMVLRATTSRGSERVKLQKLESTHSSPEIRRRQHHLCNPQSRTIRMECCAVAYHWTGVQSTSRCTFNGRDLPAPPSAAASLDARHGRQSRHRVIVFHAKSNTVLLTRGFPTSY
jgi:hypothetical protein